MTLDDIVQELDDMPAGGDAEAEHSNADRLLCEAIRALGREDIAAAFERAQQRVGFWYA